MWLLPKKGGLLVCGKNSWYENNEHAYVFILYHWHLSMTLTLSRLSNKSSYFLQITLYVDNAISKWYTSFTRFSLHIFMFAWWLHDVTSTLHLCECCGFLRVKAHGVARCGWIYFLHNIHSSYLWIGHYSYMEIIWWCITKKRKSVYGGEECRWAE